MYVIDACVYVSDIRRQESEHQASRQFLNEVRVREPAVSCPEILIPEVASVLGRGTGDIELAETAALKLRRLPSHRFVVVDEELANLAAAVGAAQGLRGMDAIYVALARREGARFITWDKHPLDHAPPDVLVLTPAQELAKLTGLDTSS